MIKTDVLILGSGIAALTLSLLLKRKGVAHIVLDRTKKQKVMALAETLPPSAMTLLESLDLLSLCKETALRKTYGYHAMWASNHLQTTHFFNHNPYKYGLKINKQKLRDELLKQNKTAVLSYDQLVDIESSLNGYLLTTHTANQEQHINAKLIVDATGRNRVLLKALGVFVQSYDSMMAFSCHIKSYDHPKLVHDVYTESFEGGWGIVSGLTEETQVMSLFTNKSSGLHTILGDYENWKTILKNTSYLKDFLSESPLGSIHGGNANSSAPELFADNNWIAIGDAAMAFDPLSSHGITNAIYTAHRAAEVISQPSRNLSIYHKDLSEIYIAYLKTKNSLYLREARWPESDFWKGFHKQAVLE